MMSEIPDDVMAKALLAFGQTWAVEPEDQPLVDRIARAIMAERAAERAACAQRAEKWSTELDMFADKGPATIMASFATAIRSGK